MLHTKFCGKLPDGSGEEDFEGFLPYIRGAIDKFAEFSSH